MMLRDEPGTCALVGGVDAVGPYLRERPPEAGAVGAAMAYPFTEHVAEMLAAARLHDCALAMQTEDLKGRLCGVLLNASVLQRLKPGAPDAVARVRDAAREIHDAAMQMKLLLDEMPEIDRACFADLARVSLPQRVSEMTAMAVYAVEPLARLHDVRVSTEVREGATLLTCDRARMVQVIAALLAGAVRRTPARGSVRVTASRLRNRVHLAVRDEGCTLSPDEVTALWTAPTIADPTAAPIQVYVARRGVELHGGSLRARPDLHGGMIFDAVFEADDEAH